MNDAHDFHGPRAVANKLRVRALLIRRICLSGTINASRPRAKKMRHRSDPERCGRNGTHARRPKRSGRSDHFYF